MKKFILLSLIILLMEDIAFCYEPPILRYYSKGFYINHTRRNKEVINQLSNTYVENNKKACDRYYCLIPYDKGDIGYLVIKTAFGTTGYVYNHSYMSSERQRCHRYYDTYPIVNTFKEVKEYKD